VPIRRGRWVSSGVAVLLSSATSLGQSQVVVGPNVHVSTSEAGQALAEMQIAADPANPQALIACSMLELSNENRMSTVVFASVDGGKSWKKTLDTRRYENSGDPACTFGKSGIAHFAAIALAGEGKPYGLVTYVSTTGGATWRQTNDVAMEFQGIDRESIVVDTARGPVGRLYMAGLTDSRSLEGGRVSGIGLWASNDAGASLEGPVKLHTDPPRTTFLGANVVRLSDGTLIYAFGELLALDSAGNDLSRPGGPNLRLRVAVATSSGTVLRSASSITSYLWTYPPQNVAGVPSLAVDASPGRRKDRLYAVWSDAQGGRSEIYFAASSDRGGSWTQPIRINDDTSFGGGHPGPDDFMPTIAVNRDGVIGVTWYDRRDHLDNVGWNVRFRASLDGGDTWLPSVRLSEQGNNYNHHESLVTQLTMQARTSLSAKAGPIRGTVGFVAGQFFARDYAGLAAAADGVFHALWSDNRTGVPQLWTTAVRVVPRSDNRADQPIPTLEDVTARVAVSGVGTTLDSLHDTLRIRVRVTNTSPIPLRLPLRLRFGDLASQWARKVHLVQPHGENQGGIYVGTEGRDALAPGVGVDSPEIKFVLDQLRPVDDRSNMRPELLGFAVRVFAEPAAASGEHPRPHTPGGH
jgi:hypothetical protein